MEKFQKNPVLGIIVLVMLASAPVSVSYSYAENYEETGQNFLKSAEKTQRALVTEFIEDGKLKVHRFGLPDNFSHQDIGRVLVLPKETASWAFLEQKGYHSGIVLYDGNAIRLGENQWEIQPNSQISVKTTNQGTNESSFQRKIEEFAYRVVFSGKIPEAGSDNHEFVLTSNGLKGIDTGQCLKIMKSCEFTRNSISSSTDQTLPNYYRVW